MFEREETKTVGQMSVGADTVDAMQWAIEAIDLVKRFGDHTAVDGVSFAVPTGTVLGLLGPNGAGKTTTVRMMTTLTEPTAGTARVAGYDVRIDPDAVRRNMGLTGQVATVDELLTGRENIRMIGGLYGIRRRDLARLGEQLLEQFSLTDAGDRVVKSYSGGMRRRLDLAVSLLASPPVLFLDEPTTGLDPRSRSELWDVLRGLVAEGTTLLLTTQYLEEADQLADNIVVIDRGRIIAEGSPRELKQQAGRASLVVTVTAGADVAAAEKKAPLASFVIASPSELRGSSAGEGTASHSTPRILPSVARSLKPNESSSDPLVSARVWYSPRATSVRKWACAGPSGELRSDSPTDERLVGSAPTWP